MLYKHKDGRTVEVAENEATKARILGRKGFFAVKEDTKHDLGAHFGLTPIEPPEAPPVAPVVDDLPDDFPEREALTEAGYGALLLVSKATDDELRAVKGIGKATLKAIRDYALHN